MMIEDDMRNFIVLAETLNDRSFDFIADETVEDVQEVGEFTPIILHDLDDLATRLRAFMETETGDYALGVEMGMQRAADMIDNLIRRYKEGGPLE